MLSKACRRCAAVRSTHVAAGVAALRVQIVECIGDGRGLERRRAVVPRRAFDRALHHDLVDVHAVRFELCMSMPTSLRFAAFARPRPIAPNATARSSMTGSAAASFAVVIERIVEGLVFLSAGGGWCCVRCS